MRDWLGKRYWIVGASEGLGRALAHQLSRVGVELVLSARNGNRLAELADALPGRAHPVACDVADRGSVERAAGQAGEIDGLVYLAGLYWPLRATQWDADRVEAMCDVNFTGCARVLGQVVPRMVARDEGHVVLTGSLAAFRGLPGAVGYGASKAGVVNLAESLHADLRGTGVQVQVGNPGFVRTRMTDKNDFKMPFLMEPEAAARQMFELMNSDALSRSFPLPLAIAFRLAPMLPDWLYYRVFKV